jgi:hypothetical protein
VLGQGTAATANVAPGVRGRAPRPGAKVARRAKRVVERTQAPRDATRGRVLLVDAPGDPGHPGRQIVQRLLDVRERVTKL